MLISLLTDFIEDIGLAVRRQAIDGSTQMPGVTIEGGVLLVDELLLRYPGDLLHEAGHLATTPAATRPTTGRDAGGGPAGEMMAIAWSYAAAVHLGLDPAVVFHAGGYRGGSAAIIDNFRHRRYIGLPML
ncbi:MAG TPA: hypothetical protein VHT75_09065, partial [Acidimicrobiales bacterium]|nr:hypothetical protein [Acidimicrobiales bacterium]